MTSSNQSTRGTSSRDDVLQFLDSLDDYTPPPPSAPKAATPITRSALSSSTSKPPSSASSKPSTAMPATGAPTAAKPTAGAAADASEAQSVLDFLDEITQRSSTPTATVKPSAPSELSKKPSTSAISGLSRSSSRTSMTAASGPAGSSASAAAGRRSTDSVRSQTQRANQRPESPAASSTPAPAPVTVPEPAPAPAAGGWGWGSVWSQASSVVATASSVVQQARTVAEGQLHTASQSGVGGLGEGLMKALQGEEGAEQARKWKEGLVGYAKGVDLDSIGSNLKSTTLRSLTDLLNAVAPPIAEHEVIEVNLSHDMVGYEGVETLVFRGMGKIMDQIEGGSLVINSGETSRPAPTIGEGGEEIRNLNTVEGLQEGWKMAEANLSALISSSFKPNSSEAAPTDDSVTVPVTRCPIYLRIQPCIAPLPSFPSPSSSSASPDTAQQRHLFFLLLLRDPTHSLSHASLSQSIPAEWLDIPFEENEWVEDVMVGVIARAVETLGQEYVTGRMRAQSVAISKAREEAQRTLAASATGPSAAQRSQVHPEKGHARELSKEEQQENSEAMAMSRVAL